ncbi:hypothetical protein GORDON_80 [Arthrobacter phage Gordon]|uniref:Uncharacterized protein n=1 Tax=Arthrobacter phage Gordon TaxID=1772298 RepID=A0A0U4IL85_9CAUD|nr:hypothetical protein FDH69_gp80 [Arthrobacter phage Gordon]ALY09055.1 hypothetical protein GORDON_80 [Arthrobacter phage Gordon]
MDRAEMERYLHETRNGRGEWPPVLPPPDETIETMLDWHSQGCEWPVGGDELVIVNG